MAQNAQKVAEQALKPEMAGGIALYHNPDLKQLERTMAGSRFGVVVLSAEWCGPCKHFEKFATEVLANDPRFAGIPFVFSDMQRLDGTPIQKGMAIFAKYRQETGDEVPFKPEEWGGSLPQILFFAAGKPVEGSRLIGFPSKYASASAKEMGKAGVGKERKPEAVARELRTQFSEVFGTQLKDSDVAEIMRRKPKSALKENETTSLEIAGKAFEVTWGKTANFVLLGSNQLEKELLVNSLEEAKNALLGGGFWQSPGRVPWTGKK